MTASVVVITRDQDTAADLVVNELQTRGVGVVRFDVADFPESLTQVAYLVPGRTRWTGAVRGAHRDVDLSAVRAVWYRKPSKFRLHPGMTATEQQWAAAEAQAGFGGLLAALPGVHWVNHPHRNAEADHKPRQLALADSLGLAVPETLLTNDPEHARAFCHAHRDRGGVIYKPLCGGPESENGHHVALWAGAVTPDEITDGVTRTAHMFQARVPCAYAVRLTIVGDRMFAVAIETPDSATVDWREVHDQLTYTPVDVPAPVRTATRQLMKTLGLVYAASDWIVTPTGQWVFIGDVNPNGQWGWIQAATGLPIAAAIADELTKEQP